MKLLLGDCLDKLKELDDNSVDSIVTDPPYGLAFMGKKWDYDVPSQAIWEECMRVLKPGGHILSFAGSRTYHRMAVRIEDAGFEIRDQIMWIYGSGFPKSHNIGKAIDKIEGNVRAVVGETKAGKTAMGQNSGWNAHENRTEIEITKGNSEWEGWGTALKPAHEPIVMARKPLIGTVADNVLEYGVGGLNIDGCRVGTEKISAHHAPKGTFAGGEEDRGSSKDYYDNEGRFPANIIFECTCENPKIVADKYDIRAYNDYKNTFKSYEENNSVTGEYQIKDVETTKVIHTDPNCPCYILDGQSGKSKSSSNKWEGDNNAAIYGKYEKGVRQSTFSDEGGASRFFYCPKASKSDRDEGMPESVPQFTGRPRREDGSVIYKETHAEEWAEAMAKKERKDKTSLAGAEEKLQQLNGAKVIKGRDAGQDSRSVAHKARPTARMNIHPTVKPTELMKYLIRLVTPKGGVVLDPFMGSGSTGKAAVREGMEFIGIEREEEYYEIAKQRIENETNKRKFW
jgi:site-specific DNA-methyltransferase (adenine-specific)